MKRVITTLSIFFTLGCYAQSALWPQVESQMKPAARWWWMGSAVDSVNLTNNIAQYAEKGIGGLEITPIYGVRGNEKSDIPYLCDRWMDMYRHTVAQGAENGVKIDMNGGTGWPFGGPNVGLDDAAAKVFFVEYRLKKGERLTQEIVVEDQKQIGIAKLSRVMGFSDSGERIDLTSKVVDNRLLWKATRGEWRVIALFSGRTLQRVKRAAPAGEGYVINHLSERAVRNYLSSTEAVFERENAQYPNSFFNDSYEVYGADWSDGLLEEFEKRRGYKLEMYLPEFIDKQRTEVKARLISDYRETLAELLLENFSTQWTNWAHKHKSTTRSQAHGSPGNLIDLYAAVDIPECESFGISDFNIKGLRVDSIARKNDSDLSMLKYASSSAHITGKKYVSAETFTWLTEHFRTSLSQCKPDLDLLFLSGVNRVFMHGTTYSPQEATWPGWKFYASVDMSPTNSTWRDAGTFFDYITRCQSYLQYGEPDNDFLLYLPIYDMWHEQDGRLMMFDIHKMQQRAPKFIAAVNEIVNSGYDMDYISDNYLLSAKVEDGRVKTDGGATYKTIIVPAVNIMPAETLAHLEKLAREGATVIFVDKYPTDVPGLHNLENRRGESKGIITSFGQRKSFEQTIIRQYHKGRIITASNYRSALQASGVSKESMKTEHGLSYIRRSNEQGHHYFISALKQDDTQGWITLGVDAQSVVILNPMDGSYGVAKSRVNAGRTEVYLQIASGESIILRTFNAPIDSLPEWGYYESQSERAIDIKTGWQMRFIESEPAVEGLFPVDKLGSWTDLESDGVKVNMGTALYRVQVELENVACDEWLLDLGDVRESARVRINGQEVATLWAVPFRVNVGRYLKKGSNEIEIEVTNLPANRIADYDRRGVEWRIFKDINFVKQNYKEGNYSQWEVVPSGLLGPVVMTPVNIIKK